MHQAFLRYCARVDWFVSKTTGIRRAVNDIDEPRKPYYSRHPCEVCHTSKQGIRVDLAAEWKTDKTTVMVSACLDCTYCIEHGKPAHRLVRIK